MDDQWIYPSGSQASAADQLDALQRAQDELWVKLRREDDPEKRMDLLSRFGENRDAIERLTRSVVAGPNMDLLSERVHEAAAGDAVPGDAAEDTVSNGEPIWAVEIVDPSAGNVTPLSFSDAGELVAADEVGSPSDPANELPKSAGSAEEQTAGQTYRPVVASDAVPIDRAPSIGREITDTSELLAYQAGSYDHLAHTSNGHTSNGNGTSNGHTSNGNGNGHTSNGNTSNGNTSNGNTSNGNTSNGHAGNGHTSNGHTSNGNGAQVGKGRTEARPNGSLGLEQSGARSSDMPQPNHDGGRVAELADEGRPAHFAADELGDEAVADHNDDDYRSDEADGGDDDYDSYGGDDSHDSDSDLGSYGGDDSHDSDNDLRSYGGDDSHDSDSDLGSYGDDDSHGSDNDLGSYGDDDVYGSYSGDGSAPDGDQAQVRAQTNARSGYGGIDTGPDAIWRDPSQAVDRFPSSSPEPAPTSQHPVVRPPRQTVRPRNSRAANAESPKRAFALLGGLVVVLGVSWFLLSGPTDDGPTSAESEATGSTIGEEIAGPEADAEAEKILAGLNNLGLANVGVERRGAVIFLTGSVPTETDRDVAVRVAQSIAPEHPIDASEMAIDDGRNQAQATAVDSRAATYQTELDRVVAATPLIFAMGETSTTDLHERILNSVAQVMGSYPDLGVTIVGYTDNTGSDESNQSISLSRAEGVKKYLVGQGVPESSLHIEARGEESATGSEALANLERRVEFEVHQPEGAAAARVESTLRIAIVAPSARNDLAFSQSIVEAVGVLASERGNVDVAITDNTFVPAEAATAIRAYAAEGYDLVIAHGSQFGPALVEIAPEYPEVVFAWGTASDTFGLDNVYAYDAASQEGGYVMGVMSTLMSETGVVGVVGPIEVGDAQLYVEGFQAGARASKPDATILVDYIGSFSDLALAAEAAEAQVAQGADVMTGTAQMVVGAVSVAADNDAYWFGTQSNQTSLAPTLVVASQVYHWEVILGQIISDIDSGSTSGTSFTADLANGGLRIEFNPGVEVPAEVSARAEEVIAAIVNGSLRVPTG